MADSIVLRNSKSNASVDIMLYGATIVSWKSPSLRDPEPSERLFVSATAIRDGSKPVRGGIPVVWPFFGPPTHPEHKQLAQHGFARSSNWSWDGVTTDEGDRVSVTLTLEPTPAITALYKRPFHLSFVVSLGEYDLSTELHVKNTSPSTDYPPDYLEFQALFHNYILAPANDVLVTPLQNLSYFDKTEATEEGRATAKTETRAGVDVRKFTDSVYENASQSYEVTWPGGGIAIKTSNLKDVVVWNPQAEAGSKMGDMEKGGWEKFICCEPGHVRGFEKVAPGLTWVGKQVLSVIHNARRHQPNLVLNSSESLVRLVFRCIITHVAMAQPCILQVQINQIDHYLAPSGPLDNSDLRVVPVIRIYGAASDGTKCCVHVHQVYPYFFVEYDGKLRLRSVNRYINKLSQSLNHAIALSLKKDLTTFKPQFVRAITLVKGIHFYGFHSSYSPFLKVHIVDPAFFNRAVTIMRSGTVMGTHFRVFESHLSFALQFMSDFGLYGCGNINLSNAFQRGRRREDDEDLQGVAPASPIFPDSPYFCQTRMPLEVDVAAFHILNRLQVTARNLHHKLTIPAPPIPPEPLVLSRCPVDPSESSRSTRGEWVSEARWWEDVRKRIENERPLIQPPRPEGEWEKWVMTTFESVEALWEEPWRTWKPTVSDQPETDAESAVDENETRDIDVDDSQLSEEHLRQLVERDAEWEKSLDHDTPEEDGRRRSARRGAVPFIWILRASQRTSPPPDAEEDVFGSSAPATRTPSEPELLLSSPPNLDHVAEFEDPLTPTRSRGIERLQLMDSPPGSPSDDLSPLLLTRQLPNSGSDYADTPSGLPPRKKRRINFVEPTNSVASHSAIISRRAMDTHMNTQHIKQINLNRYVYAPTPPSVSSLLETMKANGIPSKIYRQPYYSNPNDVPEKPREYGGFMYRLKGSDESLKHLGDWEEHDAFPSSNAFTGLSIPYSSGWEYGGASPPSVKQVKRWLASEEARAPSKKSHLRSQIEGPTQANIYGLKTTPRGLVPPVTLREKQKMTILSLEVFAPSVNAPNAEVDEIAAIFYSFQGVDSTLSSTTVVVDTPSIQKLSYRGSDMKIVSAELDLLNHITDVVVDLDPDIIVGWEIQNGSWSYLHERGQQYGLDIADLISRAPSKRPGGKDQWGVRHTSTFKVSGRHVLNLWRVMRVELTLNIYTFENVVFHVLSRRTPRYGPATLKEWYQDSISAHTFAVLRYFSSRTSMVLEVLEETEVVTKTAEFARVFGVDFFSVISRGSQFKVESFMFRIAKPESFVLFSPSKSDVGRQNAAEAMPLIMEPLSTFYTDPVLVLDFQSLYPSIMIANNYCYSTFLGRIHDFQGRQKFGVTELDLRPGLVETLYDHITVSPTGYMFVKPEVRKGLLGRMLVELLETRVMVKQATKGVKGDKALRRILDARQLGLKYIANVTYGYTSIVQSGRETLEKAIMTINATEKWGAKVVYGDTDSVFVHLPGKTKDQAFRIGYEISETITASNPSPIKLKFEKVYLPCVLLAKKRYVGFKYENPDEIEPVFDAKGIETVRRDGVLAQKKMTETCLKILFRTQDLSEVKDYCYRSWQKLLESKASVEDFIFAKEVKMGTYSDKGPPPPGAVLAARQALTENTEPQYSERVPYVICRGPPNSRLVDRVAAPLDVLKNRNLQLDADYYISRVLIPPLDRIFSLTGCDVRKWYLDMPRPKSLDIEVRSPSMFRREEPEENVFIDGHFSSFQCLSCGMPSNEDICDGCYSNPESTMSGLLSKIQKGERRLLETHRICASCTQTAPTEPVRCESLDCSWLYARTKAENKLDFLVALRDLLAQQDSTP
ncbi:DNA polymerase [Mycena venus]|uniref:DNA polymerase n=1 Tax=Mycena venus TaxID=2733690 RepID=A0A8H6XWS3_9AGAR|nr:DNA polymerase [Mycena venus]